MMSNLCNYRPNCLCESCGVKPALHRHHIYSNSKRNKAIYGKLINHQLNMQNLCYDCHLNKPVKKYTEAEFRKVLQDNYVELPELLKPTGKCRRAS